MEAGPHGSVSPGLARHRTVRRVRVNVDPGRAASFEFSGCSGFQVTCVGVNYASPKVFIVCTSRIDEGLSWLWSVSLWRDGHRQGFPWDRRSSHQGDSGASVSRRL